MESDRSLSLEYEFIKTYTVEQQRTAERRRLSARTGSQSS